MTNTETPKDYSEVVANNDENYKPELIVRIIANKCDTKGNT